MGEQLSPMQDLVSGIRNSRAVRWYVLSLPSCHRGVAKGLEEECARRVRSGEPSIEYYAPTYMEVSKVDGEWVRTKRPFLYNYVFVRASENEIYRMMCSSLPQYSFLPRIRSGHTSHYPYLTDSAMSNLRWIAKSYSDVIPVCSKSPGQLVKGDRVRITGGRFKGAEATVYARPGVGQKDLIVSIDNWIYVPLLHVAPDEYEVISLNRGSSHVYTRLGNERLSKGLHDALGRYHSPSGVTGEDIVLANEVLREFAGLRFDSDNLCCRQYSLLLPAYTVLGMEAERNAMMTIMLEMVKTVKSGYSRALVWTTLYGCTDNYVYHTQAHAAVDCWRGEPLIKKRQRLLSQWLDDFDEWFGHVASSQCVL